MRKTNIKKSFVKSGFSPSGQVLVFKGFLNEKDDRGRDLLVVEERKQGILLIFHNEVASFSIPLTYLLKRINEIFRKTTGPRGGKNGRSKS